MDRSLQSTLSRIAALLAVCACGMVSEAQQQQRGQRSQPPARGSQNQQGQSVQRPPARVEGRPARAEAPPREGGRPLGAEGRSARVEGRQSGTGGGGSDGSNESAARLGRGREVYRPENPSARPNSSSARPLRSNPDEETIVRPRPLPRLVVLPTYRHWASRYRSIYSDIRFLSRRGFIPVTAVPPDVYEIVDYSETPAGWRGYGFVVPEGESIAINLEHTNRAWFRLIICDSWGQAVPGALNSKLPQFEPKLAYKNNSGEARAIYLIVDDPGWMSSEGNPYTLEIAKSWDPALIPVDQNLIAAGIWGLERSVNAKFMRPMLVMPGFK